MIRAFSIVIKNTDFLLRDASFEMTDKVIFFPPESRLYSLETPNRD